MPPQETDPYVLLRQAADAGKPTGVTGWFKKLVPGDSNELYEDASAKYRDAGHAFRSREQEKEAGDAFVKAAEFANKADDAMEAAKMYEEAFKAYSLDHAMLESAANIYEAEGPNPKTPGKAPTSFIGPIRQNVLTGNRHRAGKLQEELAQLYETKIHDPERAVLAYEKSAKIYRDEKASALANKHLLKAAELAALHGDYYRAIEHYVNVAKEYITNNLMRYSVKDNLFKAGICHLATNDMTGASNALNEYAALDQSFASAREHKLLADLIEAANEGNDEAFMEALYIFDQMSRLDDWKQAMFTRIKENVQNKQEDFS